jgi:hypothetical protein
MKPDLLAKLDILAASQEAKILDSIRKNNGTIKQAEEQRGILSAYRARISDSWQNGSVVSAAQARRCGYFANASLTAEDQINQSARRAAESLGADIAALASVQAQRKSLQSAQTKVEMDIERGLERRLERELPPRRNNT